MDRGLTFDNLMKNKHLDLNMLKTRKNMPHGLNYTSTMPDMSTISLPFIVLSYVCPFNVSRST